MFEKFIELIKKRKEDGTKIPLHVGLTVNGIRQWCEKNNKDYDFGYEKSFANISQIIESQINNNIRILTVYVLPKFLSDPDLLYSYISKFLKDLRSSSMIHDNQVKISIIGKWYDLPNDIVAEIKETITETRDYDRFFLNFCINYNGHEEIVDACKLIAKKVQSEKLDPESISASTIKDNIYTSYFIPPDMIIKTGLKKQLFGFLLWDSARAKIIFTSKLFPEYTKEDFLKDLKI